MVRENIRYFVLKTNQYRLFRILYRAAYLLALKLTVSYLRRMPKIETIYLKNNLFSKDWVPGDSDIDLAVIIKNLSTQDEIQFMISFWSKIDLIAKVFPFIFEKDVSLLTTKEFQEANFQKGYAKYIFDTPIDSWQLLAGRELRKVKKEDKPVYDAPISYYLSNWYTALFTRFFSQPYKKRAFLRFYYKVSIRILKAVYVYEVKKASQSDVELFIYFSRKRIPLAKEFIQELGLLKKGRYWTDKPSEIIASYLYHITGILDSFYQKLLEKPRFEGKKTLNVIYRNQENPPHPRISGALTALLEKLSPKEEYLVCILAVSSAGIAEYDVYFILKENCQVDKFKLLIHTLKKEASELAELKVFPFVTTEDIFLGELSFLAGYSATEYFYIRSQGRVIFGQDIRKRIRRPPDLLIYKKFKEMAFLIKYINTKRLFQKKTDIETWEFYDLLEQRLRKEKGIITQTPSQTILEYTKNYKHEEQTKWLTRLRNNKNLYLFTKYILVKLGY